jgi:hypothetical protein
MTRQELPIDGVRDVQVALFSVRNIISALHSGQALVIADPKIKNCLFSMQTCVGLMKEATGVGIGLTDELRDVIDDVRQDKPVIDMTAEDFGRVAGQYARWLPVPLQGGWSNFVYDHR